MSLHHLFLVNHRQPERLEEMDGRLAVPDADSRGVRYVKFWVAGAPSSPAESRASSVSEEAPIRASYHHKATPPFPSLRERPIKPRQRVCNGSPDFGGGVRFDDDDTYERGHILRTVSCKIYPQRSVPSSNRARTLGEGKVRQC